MLQFPWVLPRQKNKNCQAIYQLPRLIKRFFASSTALFMIIHDYSWLFKAIFHMMFSNCLERTADCQKTMRNTHTHMPWHTRIAKTETMHHHDHPWPPCNPMQSMTIHGNPTSCHVASGCHISWYIIIYGMPWNAMNCPWLPCTAFHGVWSCLINPCQSYTMLYHAIMRNIVRMTWHESEKLVELFRVIMCYCHDTALGNYEKKSWEIPHAWVHVSPYPMMP